MDDFPQRPDETPAEWLEWLLRKGMIRDLSNEERRQLAPCIRAAQRRRRG